MCDPEAKVLVVTMRDPSVFPTLLPQIRLREELVDTLWTENDDRLAMRLIDRIAQIEDAWGKEGVRVRRKILWF